MPPIPTPSLQNSLHSTTYSTSSRSRRKHRHSDFSKSVTNLIDRLWTFLENSRSVSSNQSQHGLQGLALPAQAVSWLGFALRELEEIDVAQNQQEQEDVHSVYSASTMESFQMMGLTKTSVVLKYARRLMELRERLLPCATHVRITDEVWPPISSSSKNKQKQHMYYDEGGEHSSKANDVIDNVISTVICRGIGSSAHSFRDDSDCYFDFPHSGQQSQENQDYHSVNDSVSVASSSVPMTSAYSSSWQAPRIDLSIFPNLTVLVLDCIPPEWLHNIDAVRTNLKLIRLQGGAVFNLDNMLFPTNHANDSKLTTYPNLTHLRLSRCAVGEMSGLVKYRRFKRNESNSGKKNTKHVYSPLSRLPNLTALNLSHNEIKSASTVFAGIKNLPLLTRIDLSYNRISSLRKANYVLGNIRILMLSHNMISCLQGIDRLFSLERLALDHNKLEDLSNVAPLVKLPCLHSVHLKGNPFVKSLSSYRIQVLHLFQQARCNNMFADDVFLPNLDDQPTTRNEFEVLGKMFFSKDIRENNGFKMTRLGHSSPVKFSASRPRQVVRSISTRTISITHIESKIDFENTKDKSFCTIQPLFSSSFSVCDVISSNNTKTKVQLDSRASRMKHIRSLRTKNKFSREYRMTDTSEDSAEEQYLLDTDVADNNETYFSHQVELPGQEEEHDSCDDDTEPYIIIENTSPPDNDVVGHEHEEDELVLESAAEENNEQNECQGYTIVDGCRRASVDGLGSPQSENNYLRIHDEHLSNMVHLRKLRADRKSRSSPTQRQISRESNDRSMKALLLLDQISTEDDVITYESLNISNDTSQGVRQSGLSCLLEKIDELDNRDDEKGESDKNSLLNDSVDDCSTSENTENSNKVLQPIDGGTFSGENESVPLHDNHVYEEDQNYDGPIQHSNLEVKLSLENIKLYFRSQVFGTPTDSKVDSHSFRPRILLFKYDKHVGLKALKDKEKEGKCESFVDLFCEDVIACGRASSIRIPPKVTVPKGFDGENDSSRIGLVSEAKKTILCFSDEALYIIADEYIDQIQQNEALDSDPMNRPFPSPICDRTHFKDGVWPHAIARHCYEHLVSVTFGFQFQRLVLHFVVPGNESTDIEKNFSYVCLTRCKQKTMALFRILQVRVQEAKAIDSMRLNSEDLFTIENDDQGFLDSVTETVSPDHPGSILYYQLVEQCWNSTSHKCPVRRSCVITDSDIYLFDEIYRGDGSSASELSQNKLLKPLSTRNGAIRLQLVGKAALGNVSDIIAANEDPRCFKIVVKSEGALWNSTTNWRLMCKDGNRAGEFVANLRQIMRLRRT